MLQKIVSLLFLPFILASQQGQADTTNTTITLKTPDQITAESDAAAEAKRNRKIREERNAILRAKQEQNSETERNQKIREERNAILRSQQEPHRVTLKPQTPARSRDWYIRKGELQPGETYPKDKVIFECGKNCPAQISTPQAQIEIQERYNRELYALERRVGVPIKKERIPFYVHPKTHPDCAEQIKFGQPALAFTWVDKDNRNRICMAAFDYDRLTSTSAMHVVRHEYSHYYFWSADPQSGVIMHEIIEEMPDLIGTRFTTTGQICRFIEKNSHYSPHLYKLCQLGFDFTMIEDLVREYYKREKETGQIGLTTADLNIVFDRLLKKDTSSVFE